MAVALVQFAQVPVLQRIARFYIWVIRGTPVLVQLFVVFYGLPGVGILITRHKGQADAVRLRGGGHTAVLHGRFRFQLLAGGFIGGIQQRSGLGSIGQVSIYQRKPRICGVEYIIRAVVHAGCKHLWPGQ